MSFEITSYSTRRVKAEAKGGGTSHWVILTVIDGRDRRESEITLFFIEPNADLKAKAYAEAINSADRLCHPGETAREAAEQEALDRDFSAA